MHPSNVCQSVGGAGINIGLSVKGSNQEEEEEEESLPSTPW